MSSCTAVPVLIYFLIMPATPGLFANGPLTCNKAALEQLLV
jgi:hypothetical protein